MVSQDSPAWAPSSVRNSNSLRSLRTGTPHSLSWYATISGLRAQRQRRFSGGNDIAGEAIVQVEHPLAPGSQGISASENVLGTHDAGPLEYREQDVIAVGRSGPADKILPFQRRLRRLEELF